MNYVSQWVTLLGLLVVFVTWMNQILRYNVIISFLAHSAYGDVSRTPTNDTIKKVTLLVGKGIFHCSKVWVNDDEGNDHSPFFLNYKDIHTELQTTLSSLITPSLILSYHCGTSSTRPPSTVLVTFHNHSVSTTCHPYSSHIPRTPPH